MKYRIEIQPLTNYYVVALKDPTTGNPVKVFTVNGSAAEMLRLYRDGADIKSVAQSISQKYGAPIERVRSDVEALLGKLE